MEGSGSGVEGIADDFYYVWQEFKEGDNVAVSARIDSLEVSGGDARVGLMIREKVESGNLPGARQLYFCVDPGKTILATMRPTQDGSVVPFPLPNADAPCINDAGRLYLALQRQSGAVSLYFSRDGAIWCGWCTQDLPRFDGPVMVGLAIAASSTRPRAKAQLAEVHIEPQAIYTCSEGGTPPAKPDCPPNCQIWARPLTLVWRDLEEAIGYYIYRFVLDPSLRIDRLNNGELFQGTSYVDEQIIENTPLAFLRYGIAAKLRNEDGEPRARPIVVIPPPYKPR